MAERGYPTLEQRMWARSRSTAEILAEAEASGSAALWAVGLERMATESSDAEVAAEAALNLSRLATNNKSLFALERSALVQAHVIELAVAESGWTSLDAKARERVSSALSAAKEAGLEAALLGDGLAMMRIEWALGTVPGIQDTAHWQAFGAISFRGLGSKIKHFQASLRWNEYQQSIGLGGPYGGFTLSDIKPRPVQSNVIGDGRPAGVWVEY